MTDKIEIVLRDIVITGLLEDLAKEQDDHEATIQMFNDTLATYGTVLSERDEARGIASTLYLVGLAALKAFNAEPYGEEQYQKDIRRELWDLLKQSPEWVQRMDGV